MIYIARFFIGFMLVLVLISCDGTYWENKEKVLYNFAYANLKIIQEAITLYKDDYGRYPDKLYSLKPNYLPQDTKVFICPATNNKHSPRQSIFIYNTDPNPYWLLRSPEPLYKNINSKDRTLGYIILFADQTIGWSKAIPVLSRHLVGPEVERQGRPIRK